MKKHKPTYLGKSLPSDVEKCKKFMKEQYDEFHKCYEALKDYSEDIDNISNVGDDKKFKMKVITENESIFEEIQQKNPTITVSDNVVSVL